MRFFSSSWRGPFAVGAAFLTAVLLGHASPAAAETVQAGCMQDIERAEETYRFVLGVDDRREAVELSPDLEGHGARDH